MHAVIVTDKGVKITVHSKADVNPAPRRCAASPLRVYTDAASLAGATNVVNRALDQCK